MTWYEYLTLNDRDLREMLELKYDVDIKEVRYEHTGHTARLTPRWARSVGLWGRIATCIELEHITGVKPKAVRQFGYRHKLDFAGHGGRNSQYVLAARVYEAHLDAVADRGEYSVKAAAQKFGILPIEAKLYPQKFQEFLDTLGGTFTECVAAHGQPRLERLWVNGEHHLTLPMKYHHIVGDADDILAAKIHERFGEAPIRKVRRNPKFENL